MPYDSALSDVLRKQQQHLEPIHRRRDHDGDISHIALNALYPDEEPHCRSESSRIYKAKTRSPSRQLPTTRTIPPRELLHEPLRNMAHPRPSGIVRLHLASQVSATAQRPERLIPSTFWSEAEPVRLFASIDPGPARRMEAKRSHVIQLPVFSADRSPSLSRAVYPSTSPLKALHDRVRGIDKIDLRFTGSIRRCDALTKAPLSLRDHDRKEAGSDTSA
ncbi:hypothetical protein CDV31_005985 [Fusarium ambrosium]|uniref:Uncharacterized protein n=1 Tax=Fusarium ambrosium TaxID=131363 RepID=A0A428UG59_9HYPO|nr:hypothetical protein CDV31_005985 [Fusarium ambrosium]